jgi:phosphodiesterase/alkaline phosphatase D-like protein
MTQTPEPPVLDYEITFHRLRDVIHQQQQHLAQVEMYQNQAASLLASLSAPDMVAKVKGRIQLDYQRHLLAAAFLDFMKLDAVGVHDDRAQDLLNFIKNATIVNDLRLAADRVNDYAETLKQDPNVYSMTDADLIRLTERALNQGGSDTP